MSSFDVFGVITQDFEIAGSAVRQRRFLWQPERSASSLYLGRERREMASDTIQKTRKTLSVSLLIVIHNYSEISSYLKSIGLFSQKEFLSYENYEDLYQKLY